MVAIKRPTIVAVGVGVVVVIIAIVVALRYRRRRIRESYVAAILPPMGQPISQDLLDAIQAYQMSFVDAYAKISFAYDPRRDGSLMSPKTPGIRPPANAAERKMLGYYQYQCANLLSQIARHMPSDPRYIRLQRNFSHTYVAICSICSTGGNGQMHPNTDGTGTSVMAVNITKPIAKALNTIAHEMAHCALLPLSDLTPAERRTLSPTNHGQVHTDTWKLFVHIGTKFAGWHFVEFWYQNCCQGFNICDLREFDQTKVYSVGPGSPWGKKLVKWA